MRRDGGGTDEQFAAYVRERGDHHLRVAVLLTGDWHAAEDLVQASLVKLYRAWPRLDIDPGTAGLDAYLRRIVVNTHRSWRARWRRETPAAVLPESVSDEDIADRQALGALVRQALASLPRQHRALLVLRYCEDLPKAGSRCGRTGSRSWRSAAATSWFLHRVRPGNGSTPTTGTGRKAALARRPGLFRDCEIMTGHGSSR